MERLVTTGRMAAGIAHDLRNAMNGLMLLELELASRPVDADLADILQVGMASLRNLLDQLQALGVYSRQKRLSMALDRVDVAKAVRQALAFMHLDMDLRRRSLAVDTPEEPLPLIIGDRSKLVQVVVNLVRNATQATDPGQRIWVSVHGGDTGLTVRVEDEGRGLPEGLSMVLFEPFVSTKGDDGLGLGLYMARIVAEHHRGTLTAVPRDPRGSVFDLYLPYLNSLSPAVTSA
jgi:signal transduction histidine kinase